VREWGEGLRRKKLGAGTAKREGRREGEGESTFSFVTKHSVPGEELHKYKKRKPISGGEGVGS